jgi:K+-transporting ATPase c subunit
VILSVFIARLIVGRTPEYRDASQNKRGKPAAAIPTDLVMWGPELTPDISPAVAEFQIPRLAKARGMTSDDLRRILAVTQCAVREANFPEEAFGG